MDWIRRNWPDLLIGFALLAVISGIVATLLTGGSFFPGQGNQTAPQPTAQTQAPVQPQQPTQPQNGGAAEAESTDVSGLPLIDPDPLADDGPVDPFAVPAEVSEAEAQEAAAADAADPLELPSVVALRPGADPQAAAQPSAQQPAATPQAPAQQQPAAESAPATAPTSSEGLPSSTVPYTVGVGAFRNQENAGRQADVFRQAGYPVVVASQDDFTVVLLGPYANRSEADRVQAAVTSGGFGISPIVYTYQDDEDGAQTSTSAAPAAAEPAAAPATPPATVTPAVTPAPESSPAPAATATGAGRYLQVGAFSSTDNATAQTNQLEGLGYTVTQEQDGALIRVLVGPFDDGQITGARNRLAAQGIDSVPR